MYHWEADQEDFLVLAGEAVLVIEGVERPLRRVGLRALPGRGEAHRSSGRGTAPCACSPSARATARPAPDWGGYTVDEAALRHGAGVERETTDPDEALRALPAARADPLPRGLVARTGASSAS